MNDYVWPADGARLAEQARQNRMEIVTALPVESLVTGDVIGRQPFGVFVRINGVSGAVGLAEIISMPHGAELPAAGATVRGAVIWHADHNHQVRLRLTHP